MAEKKSKAGRPSKINNIDFRQVEILASFGLTDVQMAAAFYVTQQTWNNWKKENKKFFESLKRGKDAANEMVEKSLFHRACGFAHPDTKIFIHEGKPIIIDTIKYYPPDTGAGAVWAKNRMGWSDNPKGEENYDALVKLAKHFAKLMEGKKDDNGK